MKRKYVIPLMAIGILFMIESASSSAILAPTWSYRIKDMTQFSMSRNGEYLIAVCEKPGCEGGQFYVFDQYGNVTMNDCIEGKVTSADIADNGAFFLGTDRGYYFYSGTGGIQEDTGFDSALESVSMSQNGRIVIAGTGREILIFEESGIKNRKEIGQPAILTASSASGDIAVAGTADKLFLFYVSRDTWVEKSLGELGDSLAGLSLIDGAISDDGSIIVCSMTKGMIMILDSTLEVINTFPVTTETETNLIGIALTVDGRRVMCGTDKNEIFVADLSGNKIWSSATKNNVQCFSMSSDGNLAAVLSDTITLFNSSGRKLQNITFSQTVQSMHISGSGEVLSYSSNDELVFLVLYQSSQSLTHEYEFPSKGVYSKYDRLEIKWSYGDSPHSVVASDVNGDGQKEIVVGFPKDIAVLNSGGEELWKKSFKYEITMAVVDLTSDFVPEIVVTSKNNLMRFQAFDGNGRGLATHDFYTQWYPDPLPEQAIEMSVLWSSDIDNDGYREIVCKVFAASLSKPRGIYVFQYPSFEREWYYPFAPEVETVNIVDLDGDEIMEIVCGSGTSCYGRSVDDTDDCHAYVLALNSRGERLWIKEMGEGLRKISVSAADIDGDGAPEIVCGGHSTELEWGELFILDSEGKNITSLPMDYPIFISSVADFDSDGDMEILVSDSENGLSVYDHNLRPLIKVNVNIPTPSTIVINDLDGNGEKEIIMISNDMKIIFLNSQLEEESNISFPDEPRAVVVATLSKCKNDLLVLTKKLHLCSYGFDQSYQPCPLLPMSPEVRIDEYIEKGDDYDREGVYLKAAEEYDLAIKELEKVGDTEKLEEVTEKRRRAYERYISELSNAGKYLEIGIDLRELKDYEEAEEFMLRAQEIYRSIGRSDLAEMIDESISEVRLLRAEQFFREGKGFSESKDFKKAEELLLNAKELFESLGELDMVKKIDEKLSDIELPLEAERLVETGDEEMLQENYEEASYNYEHALLIYEGLQMDLEEEIDKVQEKIREAKEKDRQYGLTRINFSIIVLASCASFAAVTFSYVRRREYKGGNKRKNLEFYGFTIMVLAGIVVISRIAVDLPLGYPTYLVTAAMCLLLFMILTTYLRRPQNE
ncbi:MAG: hypothetical protein HXS44_09955 [Theionarchaea archaeon]|nr:hypothetical protein [Theionarchaea archaeon]